ncbi:MAG: DNA-3-methyladenine glycosylase [Candidatus Competibacterales bacterium]|nr:DNA-3-methyladenine glycosylase [Candidatus Competibacterales bacterium]
MNYDMTAAVTALRAADPRLAMVIAQAPFCNMGTRDPRDPTAADLFQSLLRSIVYQQLSGKAAATIHARVEALFPGVPEPAALLALSDEALRGAGLSRNKTLALRDLAAKTLDGTVPALETLEQWDDEAVIRRLVQVRGIGRWTVEMLLMFRLRRPDVLPVDDLGVRKGFRLTYGLDGLPDAAQLRERAEAWRPYRSVASWYLWRAVELWG